jgi:hypothetical protein
MSPRAALEAGRLASLDSIGRSSISATVGASPPDVAALLVFEELAHMTRVRGRVVCVTVYVCVCACVRVVGRKP